MILYRIVKSKFANLSGDGAKEYGGRWNPKGLSALYTAESVALAVCESLVHMEVKHIPMNRVLVVMDVPDREISTEYEAFDHNQGDSVSEGEKWLRSGKGLCIKVPSKVMPHSFNYMINTDHPEFSKVKILEVSDFDFDRRFFT